MTTNISQIPFDQNDKKYRCLCGKLHIRKGARIVSVLVCLSLASSLIFSLTRSATVAFQSIFSVAFGAVIFGFLLYGTFKEKRMYIVPYMIFQVISLAFTFVTLLALLIMIAVNSHAVVQLAEDYYNLETQGITQEEFDKALSAFVVVAVLCVCFGGLIQAYFLEVIYRFWIFLKDRESSFNFNFDTSTTAYNNTATFGMPDPSTPPAYGTLS